MRGTGILGEESNRRKKKIEEESSRERMRLDGRGGLQRKRYNERVTMV